MILDSNPHVVGPLVQVQAEPVSKGGYIGGRPTFGYRTRPTTEYRPTWPIDQTGGDSVPALWAIDHRLVSTTVERAYAEPTGTITAVYRKQGDWEYVWEEA